MYRSSVVFPEIIWKSRLGPEEPSWRRRGFRERRPRCCCCCCRCCMYSVYGGGTWTAWPEPPSWPACRHRWYIVRIRDVVRSRSPSWRCFYTGEHSLSYDKSSRNVKPPATKSMGARGFHLLSFFIPLHFPGQVFPKHVIRGYPS